MLLSPTEYIRMSSTSDTFKELTADQCNQVNQPIICLKELSEVSLLDNSQWNRGKEACQGLADTLRTAAIRNPVGSSGIIQTIAKLLKQATSAQHDLFKIQALRVLGNLCFDNDSNRQRVKESGINEIVSCYLESDNKDLVRTTCGFYLNSSMEYAPNQISIAQCGAAKGLLNLINPGREDDGSVTMAIKILDSVVGEEEARKLIADTTFVDKYLTMLESVIINKEYADLDILEQLTDTLLQVVMDDDALQNEIIDFGKLDLLLNFLDSSADILDTEDKERFEEIRRTVSKITVFACSTDSKMNELYNNQRILTRFMQMVQNDDEVIHQCATYALANLARSDDHCIELVEKYHLPDMLLDLYKSTENATFQYAILGCLKHLCLPVPNKSIIGKSECISILSPTLETSKDMLKRNQFLTIGIIKLLCTGNYDNCYKVIKTPIGRSTPFNLVLSFVNRVDDVAAKSEATRVLTNIVKAIWTQRSNNDIRKELINAHILEPMFELVRISTFPVLKNDGLMALTLIFADKELEAKDILGRALSLVNAAPPNAIVSEDVEVSDVQREQQLNPETRSFLTVLADDLVDASIPVQIKCNICLLLCKIVEAARLVQNQEVVDHVRSYVLEKLLSIHDNPALETYSGALIRSLQ